MKVLGNKIFKRILLRSLKDPCGTQIWTRILEDPHDQILADPSRDLAKS